MLTRYAFTAEKYKLYKQLSKRLGVSASTSASAKPVPDDRRRTPPPSATQDHHLASVSSILSVSKHRAVKTEAPLLTVNPFSPVKHKGKARDKGGLSADSHPGLIPLLMPSNSRHHANPFATPSKSKPRTTPRKIPSSELEEDPFPLIVSHLRASSSKAPPQVPPASLIDTEKDRKQSNRSSGIALLQPDASNANGRHAEDAVTRARKRLRGEHVSPSPVKEKRARVGLERVLSSGLERGSLFSTLQAAQEEDSDEEPVRRGRHGFDEEFIAETPAKPANSGKTFVKLFDEALPAPSFTKMTSQLRTCKSRRKQQHGHQHLNKTAAA